MCRMLLSINPEHVVNIFSGEKQYEFRKVHCKKKVEKIVIYSTAPVMQVVGEVDVLDIYEEEPETLWNITAKHSGITKDFFDEYYKGKEKAVAFKLGKVKKYKKPYTLADFGLKFAPQSFVYLQENSIFST